MKQAYTLQSRRSLVALLCAMVACSVLIGWLTRSRCVRLNLLSAATAIEDGLLWFEFPMQRRSNGHPSRSSAIRVFERDATYGTPAIPEFWKSGPRYMAPTRALVRLRQQPQCSSGFAAGFGWHYDAGYSGPDGQSVAKFRLISPIWFAVASVFVFGVGLYRHRKFAIRSVLLVTMGVAGFLWFIVVPVD